MHAFLNPNSPKKGKRKSFLTNDFILYLKEKIHNYAAPLIEKAASMLTSAWKTNTLNIPKSMEPPFMRLVQLPQQKEQLTDVCTS